MKSTRVDMCGVKDLWEMQKCVKVIHIIVLRHFIGELRVGVIHRLITAIIRDKKKNRFYLKGCENYRLLCFRILNINEVTRDICIGGCGYATGYRLCKKTYKR